MSFRKENVKDSDVKNRQNRKIKINELTAENKLLHEENGRLSTENRHLKEENGSLAVENRHLEERIRGLQFKGKLPVEDTQRQDNYISPSISQFDHQSVYVQDHHGVDSNNEEVVYILDHYGMDSNIEGAIDGVDGLDINDLRSLLLPENEMNQNGRVSIHEYAPEHPEFLSCMCHADMAMNEFLMKLDGEVLTSQTSQA